MNDQQNRVARWLEANQLNRFQRKTVVEKASGRNTQNKRVPFSPLNPQLLPRFIEATPSRIAVGRAGTRYLTRTYLEMRAEHAIAKDAVYSEISEDFVRQLGLLPIHTLCKDREEYLLHPDHGRRLNPESLAKLQQEGSRGCDVQVIVGDGLAAWAAERNAPELLPCLENELRTAGFSTGRPLFVRFARVGVQDHIGVTLGAKATVILVGERPGLGTGDSLSVYIAYGPKLDQDNAEKNCISNVRPLGILPPEAARHTVEILRRAFTTGRGGIAAS